MTIGTLENAKAALNNDVEPFDSGSSRRVYLIDGVVYKVERYGDYSNRNEVACAPKMAELVENSLFPFRVPEVTAWNVDDRNMVVAMEFIDGEPMRPWGATFPRDAMQWLADNLGYDCGGLNVVETSDGWWYLIDLDACLSDVE